MPLTIGAVDDKAWDEFCATSPSAWFWHTTGWRDYTLAYRPEAESTTLAFGVFDGGNLVAAVPLMRETAGDGPVFTFGGGSCWAPALADGLDRSEMQAALRRCLEHVDELAAEHGAGRAAFAVSPLVPGLPDAVLCWAAAAVRAGYLDATRVSQLVDLRDDEDRLLRAMTKGHRAAVKQAQKSITVDVVVGSEPEVGDVFAAYQDMHHRAAGRSTRPQRTFDLMREWLGTGNAVLFAASRDQRHLGFAYVLRFGRGAYYASAANDPDASREPVGHALQWRAMTWLREEGVTTYELGLQPFGLLPHDEASEKELAIARFKRGFGGVPTPMMIGERRWPAGQSGPGA